VTSLEPPDGALPLPALASQLFVAFVIEADNEFEHQMPHRTTRHGRVAGTGPRPWLVSLAMWAHCMRLVPDEGITAGDLARASQLTTKSTQMMVKRLSAWWGYLQVDGDPKAQPRASLLVRPTAAGRQARQIWAPLIPEVESRWQARFGESRLTELRQSLQEVADDLDAGLPDFMPVGEPRLEVPPDGGTSSRTELSLPALLSKVLLALALDFEDNSSLSMGIYTAARPSRLAISANVLRVLDGDAVRVADVPGLTGVAKMAIDNWLGSLEEHGYVTIGTAPAGGRYRLARLTPQGSKAREAYLNWADQVDERWQAAHGVSPRRLRAAMEQLVTEPKQRSLLYGGIEGYPDCWRRQVREPTTLPHYPVLTAKGGFPDGS
jgi:DNA-binding MarR family transcriptional regulator